MNGAFLSQPHSLFCLTLKSMFPGSFLLNRRMRCSDATPKDGSGATNILTPSGQQATCTVFVGNCSCATEEELLSYFSPFGEITRVKLILGKCGFVDVISAAFPTASQFNNEFGRCFVSLSIEQRRSLQLQG